MTKLPPDAEQVIRHLNEADEAGLWVRREPYRRRLLALWSSFREVLARKALRRFGVLEHFAPGKRKWGGPRRKAGHKADPQQAYWRLSSRLGICGPAVVTFVTA